MEVRVLFGFGAVRVKKFQIWYGSGKGGFGRSLLDWSRSADVETEESIEIEAAKQTIEILKHKRTLTKYVR